jgi:predicted dehydrogenase
VRLFGEAERVSVFTARLFTGRPTPDNAQLSILFKSGAIGNVFASFCVADGDNHRNQLTVNFENGTAYRNTGPVHQMGTRADIALGLVVAGEGGCRLAATHVIPDSDLHAAYQWDVFHDAVRGQRRPDEISPEIIVAGLRIVEAMAESERTGQVAAVRTVRE